MSPKQKPYSNKQLIVVSNSSIKQQYQIKYQIKYKIVVSNKVSFGKKVLKYFIGYKDDRKIRLLCVFLPKMSAYWRDLDGTKYMSFLIKDDEFLEKYNEISKKVSSSIKKGFDREPVYNEK